MRITRTTKVAGILTAIAVAGALAACGGSGQGSTLSADLLDDVSGIKVTAENAGAEQSVLTEGAVTVGEGDTLVISPVLDKGKLHLTVTSEDGGTVAYDGDVDGRVLFDTEANAGTYDVKVDGVDGATGWMTVFAQGKDELAEQDASLAEALDEAGVDPGIVDDARAEAKDAGGNE